MVDSTYSESSTPDVVEAARALLSFSQDTRPFNLLDLHVSQNNTVKNKFISSGNTDEGLVHKNSTPQQEFNVTNGCATITQERSDFEKNTNDSDATSENSELSETTVVMKSHPALFDDEPDAPDLVTPTNTLRRCSSRLRVVSSPPETQTTALSRGESTSNGDVNSLYNCSVCGRRFGRLDHVRRHHESVHLKNKAFSCSSCGMKFARKDNMIQHWRLVHQ